MSNQSDESLSKGTAVLSLVAALTCVFTGGAAASRDPVQPSAEQLSLQTRVAAVVERVRFVKPTLLRDLPASSKVAQFRN